MNKEKHLDQSSKSVLYNDNIIAVTNRHLCSRPFMEQLECVCKLHPHAIVLREKDMPEAEYLSLARDVTALCKEYDVQCILHSFINVALELNHPYIHLPLPILEKYAAAPCQPFMPDVISTLSHKNAADYQQFFKVIGTSVHSVEDAFGFTTVEPEMSALNLAHCLLFFPHQGSGHCFPDTSLCLRT